MGTVPVGFSYIDYSIFVAMLLVSAFVGIYQSYYIPKGNTDAYLLGSRHMKPVPIALSLIMSKISAILLIAIPTEVYRYGSDLIWMLVGVLFAIIVNCKLFLPVLHNLNVNTMYEYLNLRFDKRAQMYASFLSNLSIILFNPLIMFLPAASFSQVSGANVNYVTPVVCAICIFYTTIGGMKAVVWADVFQAVCIVVYCFTILVLGIISGGGLDKIISDGVKGERLHTDFTWNITARQNFWILVIGGLLHNVPLFGLHQDLVQKYLSLANVSDMAVASGVFGVGFNVLFIMNIFMGTLIYSRYSTCDPLMNNAISAPDQLVPYFVMDVAGQIPGFPGLFISGLFSAALSTLSGHLHTAGATIYGDFLADGILKGASPRKIGIVLKTIVVIVGTTSTAFVYVYEYMEGVFSIMVIIQGTVNGPLLSLFLMGMLLPRINTVGALSGSFVGLVFSSCLSSFNYAYKRKGYIVHPTKPLTSAGCLSKNFMAHKSEDSSWQPFILFRISHWYYLSMSVVISIAIASIVSCFTVKDKPVTKNLVCSLVHFALPVTPDEPPNL